MTRQLMFSVDFNSLLAESAEAVVKAALKEPVEKVLRVQLKVYRLLKAQYYGMTLNEQARYAYIDPSNYTKILERGQKYAESGLPGHEDRAAKLFYEAWIQIGMEAGFDDVQAIRSSGDWKARRFLLESRFPEIFAPKREVASVTVQDNRQQIAIGEISGMKYEECLQYIREKAVALTPDAKKKVVEMLPEETAETFFSVPKEMEKVPVNNDQ